MKNNNDLVAYARSMVGLPYWYGCFGQIGSASLHNYKLKQYPEYYNRWNDYSAQYGKRVHDCVGLIKGYIWSDSPTAEPRYNSRQDVSAYGMYRVSITKGNMSSWPGKNGTLVFKATNAGNYLTIHHVGVYSTDGYVYEAKGHEYGVVKTKFSKSEWQFWSYCPYIAYGETTPDQPKNFKETTEVVASDVIKGLWGNGEERKKRLESAGYNYTEIQGLVNNILKGGATSAKKSNDEIATEVIRGVWGNNPERKTKLIAAGYDYEAIQAIVNKKMSKKE